MKKIAGSYVVIPVRSSAVDFSCVMKLSETGAFLWRLLEDGSDRDAMIAALLDEYLVDEAAASADVDRFIEKLNEVGVLE